MRKLCILSIGIMIVSLSQAQPVAYSEARQVAQSFFAKHQKAITQCAHIEIANHHDTLFYVFNADQAYVLIAADKSSVPVLAFSNNTTFQANNIIPPVQMWMDNYANQILLIKQTQACTTHPDWSAWLHPRKDLDNDIDKVAPLLTSKWGQGMYFNYYCPQDEAGTYGMCGYSHGAIDVLFPFPRYRNGFLFLYTRHLRQPFGRFRSNALRLRCHDRCARRNQSGQVIADSSLRGGRRYGLRSYLFGYV